MRENQKTYVYGYEDYSVKYFWLDELINPPSRYKSYITDDFDFHTKHLVPITADLLPYERALTEYAHDSKKIVKSLGDKVYIPAPGDSIYYTKACKLPRNKFKDIWKRVTNPDKADVIVLPQFHSLYEHSMDFILFANDKEKQIWVTECSYSNIYSKKKQNKTLSVGEGNTFDEFCTGLVPDYRHTLYRKADLAECSILFETKCVFVGKMWDDDHNQILLLDALKGKYNKIIFEDILIESTPETTTSEFTPEMAETAYHQLKSQNPDTIITALKVIACMHYTEYRTTVELLLDMTADCWWKYKQCSVAVKYMCKELHYIGTPDKCTSRCYQKVTKTEADTFMHLYKIKAEEKIKQVVDSLDLMSDVHIDVDFNIKMTL